MFGRVCCQEENWSGVQADDIKYTEFVSLFTLFWLQGNKTVTRECHSVNLKRKGKGKSKKPIYTYRKGGQLFPTFPVKYGTSYLLGKPCTSRPPAEHAWGFIPPFTRSYLPWKFMDCLLCARHWENISEQSSHTNGLSGFQFRAWKVGSGIPWQDHRLGKSLQGLWPMKPLTLWRHMCGNVVHLLRGSWSWLHHVEGLSTQDAPLVSQIGNHRLVPWTLPSQRSRPWFCLWAEPSSGSLFFWIRSLDLRFWNQI